MVIGRTRTACILQSAQAAPVHRHVHATASSLVRKTLMNMQSPRCNDPDRAVPILIDC